MRKSRRKTNEVLLKGIHPNQGLRMKYRRKLEKLIDQMNKSIMFWIKSAYRKTPPRLAQDESPAEALQEEIERLTKQWLDNFEQLAKAFAAEFVKSVDDRTAGTLKNAMREHGWTVNFTTTPAMRDVFDASVNQNVSLIKSIPERHFPQIEGIVMRGIQQGRNVGYISKELEKQFGVTRRRAAFIARDQVNKTNAALSQARKIELGIEQDQWVHSGAGNHPRPTHVEAGRKKVRYPVREGWYDPALKKKILPGQEPNCRCIGRAVLKGFNP